MPLSEWLKGRNEPLKETAEAVFLGGAARRDMLYSTEGAGRFLEGNILKCL
jgi:hypothetical protein